jgi:hypothetical protein
MENLVAGDEILFTSHVSHSYGQGFPFEFDWIGTRDPSAWFAVPEAIAFFESLGPEQLRQYNRDLVFQMGTQLAEKLQVSLPVQKNQIAGMLNVPLPVGWPNDSALQKVFMGLLRQASKKSALIHF